MDKNIVYYIDKHYYFDKVLLSKGQEKKKQDVFVKHYAPLVIKRKNEI